MQDTELKYTPKGAAVCGEYFEKGRGVCVVGRLKQDRWTGPEGQARSKVMIVAEHVEFKPNLKKDGDGKDGDGKDGEAGAAEVPAEAADGQDREGSELKEAAGF